MAWGKALWGGWGLSRETGVNSDNWNWRLRLGSVLCSRRGRAEWPGRSTPGDTQLSVLSVAPDTHLSLLSSIRSSASEKFSTWSPLGSGCTEQRTEGGSAPMLLLNPTLPSTPLNSGDKLKTEPMGSASC